MRRFNVATRICLITVVALSLAPAAYAQAVTRPENRLSEARILAAEGREALDRGQAEQAAHLFDRAIAAIGTRYWRPGAIDDTGMKLTLSETEAQRANWDAAAHLKAGVVEARLTAMPGN